MKWKGLRQSTNVEDKRDSDPIADIINSEEYTGGKSPIGPSYRNPDGSVTTIEPDEIKVAKELGRLNREKKNPVPSPRPLNIVKTQVTPGKWTTK